MKHLILLILSITTLAGCASPEKQLDNQVVKEGALKYDFEVDQNYQTVYRNILKQGRACIKPGLTAQMIIQGKLFNDIKAADITVVLYGIFSQYPHLEISVEAIADNKTKVAVSNTMPSWNSYARAIKAWVIDRSTSCAVVN